MFRVLLLLMWMGSVMADDGVHYEFSVANAAQHLGRVSMQIPLTAHKQLELKLPVWRTGRYEVLDLSKNITNFSAEDEQGQPLNWHKSDKNTWVIENPTQGPVNIHYLVYANMLRSRVAHIDDSHAFLDASGVFMFVTDLRSSPLSVTMKVPDHWRSRSGMHSPSDHVFVADNYDQLVDSPIESGMHQFMAFQAAERDFEIVIWGEGNVDISDLKAKIEKIIQVAEDLWGDFPFQRYVFMYHVGAGLRGATEHVNSTIIQSDRFQFKPLKNYFKVLATTAHEFVHTWNVKSYRPAGIAPYDYDAENYSALFWMVEGSTSYYDDLFLLRAGIYSPKDYFKELADNIYNHLNKPGREISSVAMSSFDTWLDNDAHFNLNNQVSIYLEGALKSWALDRAIREKSHRRYSYDDVQRALFKQHSNMDVGYTEVDVQTILNHLTDSDMRGFWRTYISGTEALDFDALLAFYGLKRVFDDSDNKPVWLGIETQADEVGVGVRAVHRDSPAWEAGLTGGDVVVAINGLRVHSDNWTDHLAMMSVGVAYEMSFFSGDQLKTVSVRAMNHPNPKFSIQPVDNPTRQQQKVFKDWTGQSLPEV
ncbi:M61 family metallopeptidase [Marinicella pacifica]